MSSEGDDPHALTWPAWRGLLDPQGCTDAEWDAAVDAGLLREPELDEDYGPPAESDKGRRYLAMAQEAADGLTDEDVRLMRHATSTPGRNHFFADAGTADNGAWSRLVMVGLAKRTRDSGTGRRVYLVTNKVRAALYLYEHGDERCQK